MRQVLEDIEGCTALEVHEKEIEQARRIFPGRRQRQGFHELAFAAACCPDKDGVVSANASELRAGRQKVQGNRLQSFAPPAQPEGKLQ